MRSITEDILQWSEFYLEPKNKHLGDVPVCPYAKQARQRQTLRVLECHNFEEFQDKIIEGAKNKNITINKFSNHFFFSL